MTSMKFLTKLFLFLALLSTLTAKAQTVPDAYEGPFALHAGGFGSAFNSDFTSFSSGMTPLFGAGTFMDIKFRKYVQIEAEVRWLTFDKYLNTGSQINYSVGPLVPIHKFGKFQTYGKFLITDTKVSYPANLGYGHYLDYTMGGGVDMRLTRHLRLRPIDFEYHYIPNYFTNPSVSITPMGISVGLAYRVF
jgi:Outer membrane protein beta-barrel domain